MSNYENIEFLNIFTENWSINPEQITNMTVSESAIYLYINGVNEPSIRIDCRNEKGALSFFALWQLRVKEWSKQ